MRDSKFWRRVMENAEVEEEIVPEEQVSQMDSEEIQIMEEIVYPYQMTERMLTDYSDPAYNRDNLGDAYAEVLVKLLRSAKFWRIPIPRWLLDRLHTFGVLRRN